MDIITHRSFKAYCHIGIRETLRGSRSEQWNQGGRRRLRLRPSPSQRLRSSAGLPAQVPGVSRATSDCLFCPNAPRVSHLCPATEALPTYFTGRELCDDVALAGASISSCTGELGPRKRRHYFFFLNCCVRPGSGSFEEWLQVTERHLLDTRAHAHYQHCKFSMSKYLSHYVFVLQQQ